jgi:hypothetical protein
MKMTVVLFQIDFDRFSAMALDLDHQSNIWKSTFDSRRDLVRRLDLAGLITPDEKQELRKDDWFSKGAPILRVTADREDIEEAGFVPVEPSKTN